MVKIRTVAALILIAGIVLGFLVFQSETAEKGTLPKVKYGLDLAGGTHLVYRADVSELDDRNIDDAMQALRDVIERRVNAFGVSEPLVQVEQGGIGATGENRLIVELPGVTDVDEAVRQIGKTPLLEFKLVNPNVPLSGGEIEVLDQDATTTATSSVDERYIDTDLTGRFLNSARLEFGAGGGFTNEPVILVEFNDEGSQLFEEITRAHVGEQLAIFLDGVLLSDPVIQEAISGGTAQITGNFTPEEARELVRDLNLGALPVPIELVSTQSVGASLGAEAREAGVNAGIIGLLAVAIFLILWYRLPGVIAAMSLGIYLVLMLLLFKLVPVVLTAAGIAGFILSIGMAVDANVLIFERMKEELGEHGDMREAIKVGFSRAWPSIRDGNISSIITAVILFYIVGTSLTKGFALVWGIGIILSMLSAISISRTFLLALSPSAFSGSARFLYGVGLQGAKEASEANEAKS